MAAPGVTRTVTVDEYMRSSFSPDCDYVDGYLEERNLGGFDHARIQTLLAAIFLGREREWGVRVVVEQRIQVSPTRFRVPDVCVLRRDRPVEQIITHAPVNCIEILSPEDTHRRLREKVADYQRMGVEHVWIIDPGTREGIVCTSFGWNQPKDGKFIASGTEIQVDLAAIFADLDEP